MNDEFITHCHRITDYTIRLGKSLAIYTDINKDLAVSK